MYQIYPFSFTLSSRMCQNGAMAFLAAYNFPFMKCERRKEKACNFRSIVSVWLFITSSTIKSLCNLHLNFKNH